MAQTERGGLQGHPVGQHIEALWSGKERWGHSACSQPDLRERVRRDVDHGTHAGCGIETAAGGVPEGRCSDALRLQWTRYASHGLRRDCTISMEERECPDRSC